ncbi:hypothetical protein E0Z10_g2052 [Xylaria hypoxylon]|uniref:Uncharacterized protein n=1 Tax=Xylaria hypoxylon TaxID=37992 RepID=A0A4Z0YRV4_9PEZI|nr:hypothetical protein E0Z10_g2052 [Xylaria hypoxylon]
MAQTAPESIIKKIAELGWKHLVVEGIMVEYIKKPTLVYISFWDGDSLTAHQPTPPPEAGFGNVPKTRIFCIVENYKTAFAPLLADKCMNRLYKEVRTWAPERQRRVELSMFPRYETRGGVTKPTDYLFLENFHRTNFDYYKGVIPDAMRSPLDPLHDPDGTQGLEWWPNLVVRLSDVWSATESSLIDQFTASHHLDRVYKVFFGILASNRVRLQDYLILINRKDKNKKAWDDYQNFANSDDVHNRRLLECVKGYDVERKLPTDMTFVTPEDFDSHQWKWANHIANIIKAWEADTLLGIQLNAYFVRWKTEDELKEENERLNQQLKSPIGGRPDLGEPVRAVVGIVDELHGSPGHALFISILPLA